MDNQCDVVAGTKKRSLVGLKVALETLSLPEGDSRGHQVPFELLPTTDAASPPRLLLTDSAP